VLSDGDTKVQNNHFYYQSVLDYMYLSFRNISGSLEVDIFSRVYVWQGYRIHFK